MELGFITKSQAVSQSVGLRWRATAAQTVRNPKTIYVSAGSCVQYLYHCILQGYNPVARCSFAAELLGTSWHRFSRIPKHRFAYTNNVMLTCAFPSHLSYCRRCYQLLRTSVPDGWFQILLLPVEFSPKLSLYCHKTTGLVKRFENEHAHLHALCHFAQCELLIRLQTPDIAASSGTTFTFSTDYSIVAPVSNSCVFLWISCSTNTSVYFRAKQMLKKRQLY